MGEREGLRDRQKETERERSARKTGRDRVRESLRGGGGA